MNETLKQIRVNALHYSEKDMASKLGWSLQEYKSKENLPLKMDTLINLAKAVGKPMEYLINMQEQVLKFEINDAWRCVYDLKEKLREFIMQAYSMDDSIEFKQLLDTIEKISRKPRVAFVGRSDVGKSTLINTLIGSKTLPEAWTPTTSIIVYVKHISDRPAYCESNVMIFKSDADGNLWDDLRLSDEEYTESFCIAKGDYTILKDYGARQGINYGNTDASSAVLFIESDILNNCDLMDLPGYGTKDRDEDDSLLRKIQNVDVLVYMSLANGFMRGDDINWLQGELPNLAPLSLNNRNLAPLSNLYIVASQAHTVSNGSIDNLKTILSKGAERFEQTLSPNYWTNLGQMTTKKDFERRFFTYSTDQESLRKSFEDDLRKLLYKLPEVTNKAIIDFIKNHAKDSIEEISGHLRSFREIILQREKKKEELRKIEENEPQRINENEDKKTRIVEKIDSLEQKARLEIISGYNEILTVDNIVRLIEVNNWSKKEDDMKQLSAKISNLLNESYANVLKKYSEELAVDINDYLNAFENSAKISTTDGNMIISSSFNVKASFLGGLTGLATFGALSVWATGLGNLGGYILIAKGVSVLSAMGISVGGTASAISAIATIGGPIVIAIGISIILACLTFVMFSGGWKKSISKKILEKYDEKGILTKYVQQNKNYWNDTKEAFIRGAEQLENDYELYLSKLKKEVYESNDDELNSKICAEESKLKIYKSIIKEL